MRPANDIGRITLGPPHIDVNIANLIKLLECSVFVANLSAIPKLPPGAFLRLPQTELVGYTSARVGVS
jgi:hypothetical protein